MFERVTAIVVGKRRDDELERVRAIAHRIRIRREDALARAAAPELHDLEFLFARAATRQVSAAAMRTDERLFVRVWNETDAWKWHK